MKQIFRNREYSLLFRAQILSLLGVGVLSVALALTAYRLGGALAASKILGGIFALKMIAYVIVAPVAEVALARYHPRRVLIGLDLIRLCLLLPLAFVTQAWQIGVLLFLFYSASAGFTPLYQAMIPILLPDEKDYTDALALSRLAYTLEAILSPIVAGIALIFIASLFLFPLAALCLAGSVVLLWFADIPGREKTLGAKNIWDRLAKGLKIYSRTPRLRGLFVLNLGLSFGLAWILVNSVVFVAQAYGNIDQYYTYLMSSYGVGAGLAALSVPTLLQRTSERNLMITGSLALGCLPVFILLPLPYVAALIMWWAFGVASSLVLTPGGLILKRSATTQDLPAVFAAQFSMSHAGWLLAYPTAGWLGATLGPEKSLIILGLVCLLLTMTSIRIWPQHDPLEKSHTHHDLPHDHPHLLVTHIDGNMQSHTHRYYIDELHPYWGD